MQLYNYVKVFGSLTNANQIISLSVEPTDRQEKKMLEEAYNLLNAGWPRRVLWLDKKIADGEAVDMDAEKAAFFPVVADGKVAMPLQYLQDYMTKKMAAVQNNTSIHNVKEAKDLKEVFDDYGVKLYPKITGLVFDHVNWSAKPGQKPKVLVHAKDGATEEDVCIRFEASGELGQKFLHAALATNMMPGQIFDLSFEAIDPAVGKNARAGKKVADTGVYVNHNITLKVGSKSSTGHPPTGTKFVQKPTLEQMETLFKQVQFAIESAAQAA